MGITITESITRLYRNIRDGLRILAINLAMRFIRRIDYDERTIIIATQWDDDEMGDLLTISEFINEEWYYLTKYHIKNLL